MNKDEERNEEKRERERRWSRGFKGVGLKEWRKKGETG